MKQAQICAEGCEGESFTHIYILPSSAQAPAKPSWAEVSLIISLDGRPAGLTKYILSKPKVLLS